MKSATANKEVAASAIAMIFQDPKWMTTPIQCLLLWSAVETIRSHNQNRPTKMLEICHRKTSSRAKLASPKRNALIQYPMNCSGGMRNNGSIIAVRVVYCQPWIIIADEAIQLHSMSATTKLKIVTAFAANFAVTMRLHLSRSAMTLVLYLRSPDRTLVNVRRPGGRGRSRPWNINDPQPPNTQGLFKRAATDDITRSGD